MSTIFHNFFKNFFNFVEKIFFTCKNFLSFIVLLAECAKITYNNCMLRLKELRIANNMTQNELSQALNFSRYSITNWELGRSYPDIQSLMKLATYFDVTIDYLVGFVDEFGNRLFTQDKLWRFKRNSFSQVGLIKCISIIKASPNKGSPSK